MTIEKRANGRYRVQVWDATLCRKMHVGTFPSLASAKGAGRRAEIELKSRGFIEKPTDTTFGELCAQVMSTSNQLRMTTHAWYECALKPARQYFGDRHSVRRLSRDHIQKYVTWLIDSGKAKKTVNGYIKALAMVLEQGVQLGYLESNPARKLRNLPENKRCHDAIRVVSPEEHRRFVESAPEGYRVMFSVWPFVGLRRAEMQGLTWADVDWDAGEIRVRCQLREDGTLDTNLKTRKSARVVWLSPRVLSELRQWKLASASNPLGLVFPTPRGLPQAAKSQFYKVWRRTTVAAGLQGLDPHDMRHTFATWNLAAGESVLWVAEQMGHEKPSMTLDTYSHLLASQRGTAERKLQGWHESQTSADGQGSNTPPILPHAANPAALPVSA